LCRKITDKYVEGDGERGSEDQGIRETGRDKMKTLKVKDRK
jgi:hypothetical protein